MKKKTKQDDIETYVIAFKELINEIISSTNRGKALNHTTREILPNVKATFTQEKYQRIRKYAEEKLGVELLD